MIILSASILSVVGCGAAGAGGGEPITIKFFKKEACENPTPMGYNCRFDIQVASANIGASMYNNVPMGFFYFDKETGKWAMRPPF
jgi:hypothetical protein